MGKGPHVSRPFDEIYVRHFLWPRVYTECGANAVAGCGVGVDRKERIQREATRLLNAGVAGRVFPGGSVGVAYRDRGRWVEVYAAGGSLTRSGARASEATLYDLGALTRPFTATLASRLFARGDVDPSAPLKNTISDLRGGPAAEVRLGDLLTGRGGIAEWGGLYLDVPHPHGSAAARRWLVAEAGRRFETRLVGREVHGDLGYLLLGEALVRSTREGLEVLLGREVLTPLSATSDVLYLASLPASQRAALMSRVAPTERCQWRGEVIHGRVHDENADAFGGVAGHAGLFATARGVVALGCSLLDARSKSGAAPGLPAGFSHALSGGQRGRRLGDAFGELSLVGSSICCDETRGMVVVLMNNRIHPSRANEKILGFRPAFHDAIAAAYDS